MLSFFKKQDKPEITDYVYKTKPAKFRAIAEKLAVKDTVLVAWFKSAMQEFEPFKPGQSNVFLVEQLVSTSGDLSSATVIFLEHFPSLNKETELLRRLFELNKVAKVEFYSSLEDPLFAVFGGEKIGNLMQSLGMKEDEAISHSMITKSLERAQQKLDEHLFSELEADSAEEWIRLNIRAE